jgi:beta-phosphoglucomutase-like phosphatase (HAD superfamily)
MEKRQFVLGLDLDGCVADFVSQMRRIFSDLMEVPIDSLTNTPTYGFPEWGLRDHRDYDRLHRYAVTQKALFLEMPPISGAVPALRRLSVEGIRIRIATHRLFISYFHEAAGSQTIRWLEKHGIPYWDLCLIEDKSAVKADLFMEDKPSNVLAIHEQGIPVVIMSNPMNAHEDLPGERVHSWRDAEATIRRHYYEWRQSNGLALPPDVGQPPPGEETPQPND